MLVAERFVSGPNLPFWPAFGLYAAPRSRYVTAKQIWQFIKAFLVATHRHTDLALSCHINIRRPRIDEKALDSSIVVSNWFAASTDPYPLVTMLGSNFTKKQRLYFTIVISFSFFITELVGSLFMHQSGE